VCDVLHAFQKRIVHWPPICWIKKLTPHWFSKALGATLSHLFSNRSTGFELAGFEKLSANSKAFGAKQLRTFYSSIKLKALLKNYETLPDSLLTKIY
jgi:hypothetical protein